jgi:hypothetical protein
LIFLCFDFFFGSSGISLVFILFSIFFLILHGKELLRNTVQRKCSHTRTYSHTLTPMHARTPCPYMCEY